jgi:hypothetical protein
MPRWHTLVIGPNQARLSQTQKGVFHVKPNETLQKPACHCSFTLLEEIGKTDLLGKPYKLARVKITKANAGCYHRDGDYLTWKIVEQRL